MQFSDLLLGTTKNTQDLESIVNSINELNPDIIVFTGDLISKSYQINDIETKKVSDILSKLECILYKYAIIGDNDKEHLSTYKDILNNSDFILLDNASTYIFYKDVLPIKLTGITDIEKIDNALITEDNLATTYNIVLTHYSDDIIAISAYDVDLVLAGHSLLGQIRLPFFGGIIKKDGANTYLDSYHEVGNTKMYVSSGLGTEYFGMRILNKPEINLYRLKVK